MSERALREAMLKRLQWEVECVAEFQFVCSLGEEADLAVYFQYHPYYSEDDTTYDMHREAALAYLYVIQDLFGDIDYTAYQQLHAYLSEKEPFPIGSESSGEPREICVFCGAELVGDEPVREGQWFTPCATCAAKQAEGVTA